MIREIRSARRDNPACDGFDSAQSIALGKYQKSLD